MNSKQKGFSALYLILLLVVIGILGGTGWYVYTAKRNTEKSLEQSNVSNVPQTKKSSPATKPPTAKADEKKEFTNRGTGVSFKYPKDWTVDDLGDPSNVGYPLNLNIHKNSGNNLLLSLTVRNKDAKDSKIEPGGPPAYTLTAMSTVLEAITVKGQNYSLVGSMNEELPNKPVYEVELKKCTSSTSCAAYLSHGDGSITVLTMAKQGHGAPMDLQSDEYSQIKEIIKSLQY